MEVHLGVFLSWNLLFLGLCFDLFEPWLVCHGCLVPKPDMFNVDLYQKEQYTAFRMSEGKWCLSSAKIPLALFNFCFKVLVWSLKSKCSSSKTPRYLVQVFCLNIWLCKQKFIFLVICFLGDQKILRSVLLGFKAILFVPSHQTRFERSKFFLMSLKELMAL